jgi:hypothetical protein
MLPSPATERRTSKNVGPGPQLMSCEAQRDLIFARVRVNHLNHVLSSATAPMRPTEPEF